MTESNAFPRKLSLVVPTYNEQENLPKLFQELSKIHSKLMDMSVNLEVIVVDNTSIDKTWQSLKDWLDHEPEFEKVIAQHPTNLGVQQSLLTGIRLSSGDAIAVMQSDLQDPPEIIVQMVQAWLAGARYVATKIERRAGSVIPRIGAWLFYRVLAMVSDETVLADSSDFYLFDASLKNAIVSSSGSTPFLRASLSANATPDKVIRYERLDREGGKTNFSLKRRVNFALDAILRDLGGLVKKAIGISAVTGILSGFGLLTLAVVYLLGYRSPVGGWISTVGILLVMLSTTMLIGAVSLELLSRIYRDIPRHDISLDSEVLRSD